ncbi:hypothetical protein GCM10010104_30190 [Streptomyces indiaensis]|uniref:Transposase n=1 Tax=Streptomyces indiaensis TaxID=284033 RepID=A0ABN3DJV7_9ACTN
MRFARWEVDGIWATLLEHLQVCDDAVGRVEWTVSVDSTLNRAHQHSAGARKRRAADGAHRKMRAGSPQAAGRVMLRYTWWGNPDRAERTGGPGSAACAAPLSRVRGRRW